MYLSILCMRKEIKLFEVHFISSINRYKVAQTPNEKGDRACFRFANHDCTLYDASYYELVYISGSGEIDEFLMRHMIRKDW